LLQQHFSFSLSAYQVVEERSSVELIDIGETQLDFEGEIEQILTIFASEHFVLVELAL